MTYDRIDSNLHLYISCLPTRFVVERVRKGSEILLRDKEKYIGSSDWMKANKTCQTLFFIENAYRIFDEGRNLCYFSSRFEFSKFPFLDAIVFGRKIFSPPLNSLDLCNNIFTHDRSVLQIRNNELLQPILIISLLDEKGSTPEGPSKCFRRVFTVVRGAQTPINKSDRRSSVRVYRGKLRCELLITIIAF